MPSYYNYQKTKMFFSHFLLLSATSAIYAMTTQETEQREPIPLLLPLFGNPESLMIMPWYWKGNDRSSIKASKCVVQSIYESNEIIRDTSNKYTKTIVFGSWKFANADSGRPSSALTLAKDELANNFEFSIRQGNENDTFLKRLLRQFNKKMISIWWDSTAAVGSDTETETPIAELAIGGMNPARFVRSTEVRFKLASIAKQDSFPDVYWQVQKPAAVRVSNRAIESRHDVVFDLRQESENPASMYDAITKPLRNEMRYAVGLLKGYGRNINEGIMQYHDFNERIFEVDCQYGDRLLPPSHWPAYHHAQNVVQEDITHKMQDDHVDTGQEAGAESRHHHWN